jgi:hypothetical protein
MSRLRLSFLAILAAFCFAPLLARADDPMAVRLDLSVRDADGTLDSEWFGIYMKGKKIGYFHVSRAKIDEGGKTIYREKQILSMKLQSFGQKSELTQNQVMEFDSKPPFRLLRADYEHVDEKLKTTIKLVSKDKGYDATIVVAGTESKKHLDKLDYTMADSMSSEVWLKRRPRKGDSIVTRDLEMETLKLELTTTTMGDAKETTINGVKTTVLEVKSVNHSNKLESLSLYDDKAHMISSTVADLFEMRRETEEAAKNTEYSTDLFLDSLVKIDKGIGEAATVTALVVEVKGEAGKLLADGPRQTIVAKGKDAYELKLGKKYGKEIKATPEEIKEALEETNAYPISDPKVKALAKKALGDAKTDKEKVKRLCEFVHNYIAPSLAASLPKMYDLMERKAGDCKSYALMFACLARAGGLPCREMSGFMYIGDSMKAFGGHAWNEVVLDGIWVPVDAAWNETDIDATHISLGSDKESSGALLKTFGKLNLKLVDVEGGK